MWTQAPGVQCRWVSRGEPGACPAWFKAVFFLLQPGPQHLLGQVLQNPQQLVRAVHSTEQEIPEAAPKGRRQSGDLSPQNPKETVGCPGRVVSLTPMGTGTDGALFQVTVIIGASQDIIPQLKKKYDVDTLDMVFLDHWKERYLPDTLLLEVSFADCLPGMGWLQVQGLPCWQALASLKS